MQFHLAAHPQFVCIPVFRMYFLSFSQRLTLQFLTEGIKSTHEHRCFLFKLYKIVSFHKKKVVKTKKHKKLFFLTQGFVPKPKSATLEQNTLLNKLWRKFWNFQGEKKAFFFKVHKAFF